MSLDRSLPFSAELLCVLGVISLAGCALEARDRDPVVATAASAAAAGPEIAFLAPANNANYQVPAVVDVPTLVDVVDGVVGPADLHIRYWFNGVEVGEETSTASFTFTDVPCGYQQLAAQLVQADGAPLPNPQSVASIVVRVRCPCDTTADCDDDHACSAQFCNSEVCSYGPVANCCEHDLQCEFGWFCENSKCKECATQADCDDGNSCTNDLCLVDGLCDHTPVEGCCNTDGDCDDGLFCTTDSCDVASHTCGYVESADPLCCNTDVDCIPADPCMRYMCYTSTNLNLQWCRYGPPEIGCCTNDGHCEDGSPCTLDECVYETPEDASGTCAFDADPAIPECCLSKAQCDDSDPSTVDTCVANNCLHTDDPNYCGLPTTSAMVINELMVAPGSLPDETGEWIELFNASDQIIDLVGWKITTSAGESHTITPANALGSSTVTVLVPGVYFVLAANPDKALNGGFIPHYAYGGALSLRDQWQTGAGVTYTVSLYDPDGLLVDSVTYDSATWPLEDQRSLELTHAWADNQDPANWRAAGHSKQAAFNTPYGNKNLGLHGSPKTKNNSSLLGLLHDDCVAPEGASLCAEGRCDMQSHCTYPIAQGCCTADLDCEDGVACTTDTCDVGSNACVEGDPVADCCQTDDECEDDNPCNLDRCLGNSCRHSPDIIPGCCNDHDACSDGDPCTVDACDLAAHECLPSVPLDPGGGLQCCLSADECDDGDPATLNVCDPSTNLCVYPPDVDFCDSAADLCDDDDACTADSCDLGAGACVHEPIADCCNVSADCADDGDACTAEVCDAGSHTCSSPPIVGCCNTPADCDDGVLCTADLCADHACHNPPIDGCCEADGECDDSSDCTADTCDLDTNTCDFVGTGMCCTPGAPPAQLAVECGVDPDGPALECWTWSCTVEGACEAQEAAECCTDHADCDDSDGCTVDACLTTGICKHFDNPTPGCCADHADCEGGEFCDTGACTPKLADGKLCDEHVQCASGACAGGVCAPPTVTGTFGFAAVGLIVDGGDGALTIMSSDGGPGGRASSATHTVDWGVIEVP